MFSRSFRFVVCVVTLGLLVPCPAFSQSERFAGWDQMMEADWTFDPDQQVLHGFSVRDSGGARLVLQRAEEFLSLGRTGESAALFLDLADRFPDHVIQIEGGDGRWVGAGEWGLFRLEQSIDPKIVTEQQDPADVLAMEQALAWRDDETLLRIGRELEGLPVGRRATIGAAHLFAEKGEGGKARAVALRALQMGAGPNMVRFLETLPPTGVQRDEVSEGAMPEDLVPSWRQPLGIASLTDSNVFRRGAEPSESPLAPIAPLVRDGVVYLTDSVSVSAYEVHSGRKLFHHAGPLEVVDENRDHSAFAFSVYADRNRPRAVSPVQVAQPVVAGERLLVTEQIADPVRDLDRFDGMPINWPLPRRRLLCLDRRTGEVLWSQEGEDDDAFVNRFDVHGPVVVSGGAVYAAGSVTQGSINAYVAAFDLEDGHLLWRTFLCAGQQELTMFNRPFQEHVTSPLLLHEGTVVVNTNLGVVGCVDAWSGRIRWITGYETTARYPSRSPNRDLRRPVRWLNGPPLVEDGALTVTPLDSEHLLVLNPSTGRLVWKEPSALTYPEGRLRRHQVLGGGKGRLFVVGEDTVECLDVHSGESLRPALTLDAESGQETISGAALQQGQSLFLPGRSGLVEIDVENWTVLPTRPWPEMEYGRQVRRLALEGPVVLYTDNYELFGALEIASVLEELRAEADDDIGSRMILAEVLLGDGQFLEAAEHFDRVASEGTGDLLSQAESGHMAAALGAARQSETALGWQSLLELAQTQGQLPDVVGEALVALEHHGMEEEVDHWLDVLSSSEVFPSEDRTRALFELVMFLGSARQGSRPAELAAELGEVGMAASLRGETEPWQPASLPPLPGQDATAREVLISPRYRVTLPQVRGQPSVEFRHSVLGTVAGRGTIFLLDTDRGAVVWSRPAPGELATVNESNAWFIFYGDHLVAAARESIEVVDLTDGKLLWRRDLDGSLMDVEVVGGIVLGLVRVSGRPEYYQLLGFGLETGVQSMALVIPQGNPRMMTVKNRVFLTFQLPADSEEVGRPLLEIDPLFGSVVSEAMIPLDLPFVQRVVHRQEAILLKGLMGATKKFGLFDLREAGTSWRKEVAIGSRLYISGGDEVLVLAEPAEASGDMVRHDVFTRMDVLSGATESYPIEENLVLLNDQNESVTPHLVFLDRNRPERLVVVDSVSGQRRWDILFEEPLQTVPLMEHGENGLIIALEQMTSDRSQVHQKILVLNGGGGDDQYSIGIPSTSATGRLTMGLVDDAVVLARGGQIWIIRSASP